MEQPERKLDLKRAVSINEAIDMVPDTHLAPLVEYIEQLEKELDERDAPTRHNTIAEIERVTKERDVYKASWEQLTVEKAQSSWGEFQRQSKMLKEAQAEVERLKLHMQDYHQMHDRERDLRIAAEARAAELEAQVKRLLAKEGDRIGDQLVKEE